MSAISAATSTTRFQPDRVRARKRDVGDQVAEIDRVPDDLIEPARDDAAVRRHAGRSCGRATSCRQHDEQDRPPEIATVTAPAASGVSAAGRTSGGPIIAATSAAARVHVRSTAAAGRRTSVSATTRPRSQSRSKPVTRPVSSQSCAEPEGHQREQPTISTRAMLSAMSPLAPHASFRRRCQGASRARRALPRSAVTRDGFHLGSLPWEAVSSTK